MVMQPVRNNSHIFTSSQLIVFKIIHALHSPGYIIHQSQTFFLKTLNHRTTTIRYYIIHNTAILMAKNLWKLGVDNVTP